MSRTGFYWPENMAGKEATAREINEACNLPGIYPEGLFTHFAVADDDQEFTHLQLRRLLEAREYLRDRILSGEFFAAWQDGEIAGFCGVHDGGSLGLLYVEPKYRRTSIGSSLASYLVNWSLEHGGIPYAHIRVHNVASLKMQEKMGLYVGSRTVFWTYRRRGEK